MRGKFAKLLEKYNGMSVTVKAGFWFTVCNFLQKGVSFITIPIFTRIMSQSEYGIYGVYTSWYSILTIFLTLNLSYYVFSKGMVKYEDDRNTFVVSLQSLNTVVTIAFIAIYFLIYNKVNSWLDLTTPLMLCMLLEILIEPSIAYWTARNRFEYRYKNVLLITMLLTIANPVLGIILIKIHAFNDAVLARAFSVTVVALIIGGIIYIRANIRAGRYFSTKYWRYALAFNLPLIPHFLSQTVLNQADRIMIKSICSASDAALYTVAYSIGMAVTLFSQAIQQAFLPWLYQKLKKKDYNGIVHITNIFLLIMVAVCAVIIVLAPEIVNIVGSDKYAPATVVLPSICGSVFFIFLQNIFGNINYYFEETKKIAFASVAVAILNVLLNAVFIRLYGFVAAGYTTLFCYIVYALFHLFVMIRVCKANNVRVMDVIDLKVTSMISAVFIAFVLLINAFYSNWIIRYGTIVAIVLLLILNRNKLFQYFRNLRNSKNEN